MKPFIFFAAIFFATAAVAQISDKPDPNIIFSETFKDNTNKWPISTNGLAIYMRYKESYLMENTDDKPLLVTIPVKNPLHDYGVSVCARHISGVKNDGFGLFFGGSDNENGYVFLIASTGYYKVNRYTNNAYQELIPWTVHPSISKKDSGLNIMKVKVSDKENAISFYNNGKLLNTISGYKMYGSKLGLMKIKNQRVQFDDLEVQKELYMEFDEYLAGSDDANYWDDFFGKWEEDKIPLKEIIKYDFSTDKNQGWSFDTLHTKIKNGTMSITSEKDKQFTAGIKIYPKQRMDYAVEVDVKHTSGVQNAAYGVFIGDGNLKNDITFFISNNGMFKMMHGDSSLTKWIKHSDIKTGENAVNHVEINKSSAGYKFYVNDHLLYTYTFNDVNYYRKLKAFLVATQAQTIEFDNLKISGIYEQPMYVD